MRDTALWMEQNLKSIAPEEQAPWRPVQNFMTFVAPRLIKHIQTLICMPVYKIEIKEQAHILQLPSEIHYYRYETFPGRK